MTLTIKKPETEARLIRFATARGISTDEAAEELITLGVDQSRTQNRVIALEQAEKLKALFSQWQVEDATDDPEELARRDQEALELQLALNANRKATGERIPYPELEPE